MGGPGRCGDEPGVIPVVSPVLEAKIHPGAFVEGDARDKAAVIGPLHRHRPGMSPAISAAMHVNAVRSAIHQEPLVVNRHIPPDRALTRGSIKMCILIPPIISLVRCYGSSLPTCGTLDLVPSRPAPFEIGSD